MTALVVHDHFGGEILKTLVGAAWHFYNRVGCLTLDLTSGQFEEPIEYMDVPSNREEALAGTNEAQYRELAARFVEALRPEHLAPAASEKTPAR